MVVPARPTVSSSAPASFLGSFLGLTGQQQSFKVSSYPTSDFGPHCGHLLFSAKAFLTVERNDENAPPPAARPPPPPGAGQAPGAPPAQPQGAWRGGGG